MWNWKSFLVLGVLERGDTHEFLHRFRSVQNLNAEVAGRSPTQTRGLSTMINPVRLVVALAASGVSAHAGQGVNLILNWTPAADHSPFYYAKAQGWYEKAGIDLGIEVGKGSGVSSLKVGSGPHLSGSPISRPCWWRAARAPTRLR